MPSKRFTEAEKQPWMEMEWGFRSNREEHTKGASRQQEGGVDGALTTWKKIFFKDSHTQLGHEYRGWLKASASPHQREVETGGGSI